jgi:hypothetical protein
MNYTFSFKTLELAREGIGALEEQLPKSRAKWVKKRKADIAKAYDELQQAYPIYERSQTCKGDPVWSSP